MKNNIRIAEVSEALAERHHILIYGSLRKDCKRHNVITEDRDSFFIGLTKLKHYTLYMHKGMDYPYAAYKRDCHIVCELWEVSEATIQGIRYLERDYQERSRPVDNFNEQLYTVGSASFWVQPLHMIQKWQRKTEQSELSEIGSDWVKWCKLNNSFCYKPNQQRARKGLPSFKELHEEKISNLKRKRDG
jgi:gamma-glutamylcyclotransferase (GGCT)/AIG2-like uncharacterized protein YtfP